ncbi:caspase domain-containing protein [Flagelloscypha sp. PMI_526]|nr:caspase domain-containing protein [Flagelloscypha sp. PMI_526]
MAPSPGRHNWRKLSRLFLATLSFQAALGRKIALLIGICAGVPQNRLLGLPALPSLTGPAIDVPKFKEFLIHHCGFAEENITVLLDKGNSDPRFLPTEYNILSHLEKFTHGCTPKDKRVLFYSGHSVQQVNLDGTEKDGLDEAIVTSDGKIILDDKLHDLVIKPLLLVPQTSLFAVLDTCHAQSLLDLEHYLCNDVCSSTSHWRRFRRWISEKLSPLHKEETQLPAPTLPIPRRSTMNSIAHSVIKVGLDIPKFCHGLCHRDKTAKLPNVLCVSACKDSQTASDNPHLTMTSALIDVLMRNKRLTLKELMRGVSIRMHYKNIEAFEKYQRQLIAKTQPRRMTESIKLRLGSFAPALMMNAPRSEPQLSSLVPLFMTDRLDLR